MRTQAALILTMALGACGDAPVGPPDGAELDTADEAADALEDEEALFASPLVGDDEAASFAMDDATDGKLVLGPKDDRTPVGNTAVAPYSSTVLVKAYFPSNPGKYLMCSGTLISRDAVLTAAHCVYNEHEYGGRATRVVVIPGAYTDNKGVQQSLKGVGVSEAADFFYPEQYRDPTGYILRIVPHDYAVVRLREPLGTRGGYRSFGVLREPLHRRAEMLAYHSDLCAVRTANGCKAGAGFGQYKSADEVRLVNGPAYFNHYIDSTQGGSGGGISSDGEQAGMLFGINVAESLAGTHNYGVLFTPTIVDNITRWLDEPLPRSSGASK